MTHYSLWIVVALALGAGVARPANEAFARDDDTTGIASWYGWREHGRIMADGHPFNALGLTAASRTLPLGLCIRVTDVASGRTVVLPITDRGPYVRNRILDLSLGAAMQLHTVEAGLALVRIDRLPSCHQP